MALLQVEDLTFRYPDAPRAALQNVSFSVEAGELLVICGASGCGKSTLLRLIKRELAPFGEKSGEIRFDGLPQAQWDERASCAEIGFVQQRPEEQIVTDKVWHELAFGPESLGLPTAQIRRRVCETAAYFGIGPWFRQSTADLSGGQKQLLNLAAVTVMRPRLLLFDEPTAQLDPLAAAADRRPGDPDGRRPDRVRRRTAPLRRAPCASSCPPGGRGIACGSPHFFGLGRGRGESADGRGGAAVPCRILRQRRLRPAGGSARRAGQERSFRTADPFPLRKGGAGRAAGRFT